MGHNAKLGARGEDLAIAYLSSCGIRVLCRNWRCRFGEIDLVARDGDVMVFVEVKTRSGVEYGLPIEAVTVDKQRRIRRLAALWLEHFGRRCRAVRFDVVCVLLEPGAQPQIDYHRGVF